MRELGWMIMLPIFGVWTPCYLYFIICLLGVGALVRGDCDVTAFGAVGDNQTEATTAFSAAITACQGRGAVRVPPGLFLLRPVRLLSHTDLVLLPGAVLIAWGGVGWQNGWPNSTTRTCKASPYEAKQPLVLPRLESLLHADAVQNVTIRGGGTIDGQGWRWWPMRAKSDYWHHCRPHLIQIHGTPGDGYDLASSQLAFDNLTLHNSPNFNFHVHARHARWTRIHTSADGCPLNTDAFNVGGDDLYIADSHVHSGDDCVPLGKNSSNVRVERVTCACGNGVSPILWDTAEDPNSFIRNVTFFNMTFSQTKFAANIKSLASYRGTVENILFENFQLDRVAKGINIDTSGQSALTGHSTGRDSRWSAIAVVNVTFRNFTGTVQTAGTLDCEHGAKCARIALENIKLDAATGWSCKGNVHGSATNCSPLPCLAPAGAGADNTDTAAATHIRIPTHK